jgi:phage baseplate assembly protein W
MIDPNEKAFLGKGWAFPVSTNGKDDVNLAVYEEDISQAIRIILGTMQGERVMRPDFGVGLQALIFEPVNNTTMALVKHKVEEALITWEPRIDSIDVTVTTDPITRNSITVEIRYRVRATNTFYNLVYPFYLQEGQL